MTCKNHAGFAPIFAYLGQEGYLVNAKLRAGSQHCQNGTPDFLRETSMYCKQITPKRILSRLDSGNDSTENIQLRVKEGINFIIKRNFVKKANRLVRSRQTAWTSSGCSSGKQEKRTKSKNKFNLDYSFKLLKSEFSGIMRHSD